jgi:hypothetical protein
MKKIYIIGIAFLSLFSCKKSEFQTFESKALLQFDNHSVSEINGGVMLTPIDSTNYTFVFGDPTATEYKLPIVLKASGQFVANEREFSLEIDASSTAIEGKHYTLSNLVMKGNRAIDTIYVTLLRADLDTTYSLILNIAQNENFDKGVNSKLSYKIKFSNTLLEPSWWASNFYVYVWGPYSNTKYSIFYNVSGIIDFSPWYPNSLEPMQAAADAHQFVNDDRNKPESERILKYDENGSPLDENGVSFGPGW